MLDFTLAVFTACKKASVLLDNLSAIKPISALLLLKFVIGFFSLSLKVK